MNVKMDFRQRATMLLALMAHLKLIESAKKAMDKALMVSMELPIAEARVSQSGRALDRERDAGIPLGR